jgi:hypothetical protein
MSKAGEKALLERKLAVLRGERDAWKDRSPRNYELASALVASMEKRLRQLDESGITPMPPTKTRRPA